MYRVQATFGLLPLQNTVFPCLVVNEIYSCFGFVIKQNSLWFLFSVIF